MPEFYNRYTHLLQRRALVQWLGEPPRGAILEVGCGVGRWTRRLARAGADVVGLDLSRVMIDEARVRARRAGLSHRCRFLVADITSFALAARFDRILGVTVLQHVLEAERFQAAITCLADHLAPKGRIVLLEAAPSRSSTRCNSGVFVAREERAYLDAFAAAGLRCVSVCGVDPAPFRTWLLPRYRSLRPPLAYAGSIAATLASVPIDLLAGPWARAMAWHKVFVLAHGSTIERPSQPSPVARDRTGPCEDPR